MGQSYALPLPLPLYNFWQGSLTEQGVRLVDMLWARLRGGQIIPLGLQFFSLL